jgi:hypothetical protein
LLRCPNQLCAVRAIMAVLSRHGHR